MTKISFMGVAGSGKTYLADKIAREYGLPNIDIDTMYDTRRDYIRYRTNKKLYQRDLMKMVNQHESWVIDGYHGSAMPDVIFTQSDIVIVVQLPLSQLIKNIWSRYKIKKQSGEFSHWQGRFPNAIRNMRVAIVGRSPLQNHIRNLEKQGCSLLYVSSAEEKDALIQTLNERLKQ